MKFQHTTIYSCLHGSVVDRLFCCHFLYVKFILKDCHCYEMKSFFNLVIYKKTPPLKIHFHNNTIMSASQKRSNITIFFEIVLYLIILKIERDNAGFELNQ